MTQQSHFTWVSSHFARFNLHVVTCFPSGSLDDKRQSEGHEHATENVT
jgi:hypothetical protein